MVNAYLKLLIRSLSVAVSPPTALDTVVGRVAPPPTAAAQVLGHFMVLLKVDDIPTLVGWAEPFVTFLEQAYYRLASDNNITLERAVSIVHQKARAKLRQLEREGWSVEKGTVHYLMGAMHGYDLALCHSGSIEAYLLHRLRGSTDRPRHRWINITAVAAPELQSIPPTTAHIVSGTVGRGDTVFISTSSVTEALSLDKIQGAIGDLPLAGIKTILTRQLATVGGRRSYGLLLLRPAEDDTTTTAPVTTVTDSMQSLTDREYGTSSLIVTRGDNRRKRLWFMVTALFARHRRYQAEQPRSPTVTLRHSSRNWPEGLGWHAGQTIRRGVSGLIHAGLVGAMVALRAVWLLPTSTGRAEMRKIVRRASDRAMARAINWLRSLPRPAERLLVIALLLGFLFVQSLVFLAERQTRETSIETTNRTIADIQTTLDRAESNIVFGNDADATALVAEAERLLGTLPDRTRDQQRHRQLVADTIASTRQQLERTVTVTDPPVVATAAAGLFTQPDGLIFTGDNLLLYRGANNTFALTNLATKTTAELPVTVANIGRLTQGLLDEHGRLVFLHQGNGLAVLDLNTRSLANVTIDEAPAAPIAAAFYNDRLYLLDPARQQIWRYQRTAAGYGQRRPWLREAAPSVRDATALAVDGSIYLLAPDGRIQRLTSGLVEQRWRSQPTLGLKGPVTKLMSPPGSKSLYALNAEAQRIVVWEKDTGRLKAQYMIPSVQDLKDFAVNEAGALVYVLDGNRILDFPLTKPDAAPIRP